MQRHTGDTFSNRFRGVSMLLLIVTTFFLFLVLVRGCAGLRRDKPDQAQLKRMDLLKKVQEEEAVLLRAAKLDNENAAATLQTLAPKISGRVQSLSKMVVPGSPTQLKEAVAPAVEPNTKEPAKEPTPGTPVGLSSSKKAIHLTSQARGAKTLITHFSC